MAIAELEDALTAVGTPLNCGFAHGLCSAFYLCGFLSHAEWEAYLERIPNPHEPLLGG